MHFDEPWHAHELTFSCFRRRPFLARDRTREYFAEAVAGARAKWAFDLWAYIVMPEHVHMIVHPRQQEYSTSQILMSIKVSVSRKALGWLRKENPPGLRQLATGQPSSPYRFWQDGSGYDRNIRTVQALRASLEYIHNNPEKRRLADRPEEWVWSSYSALELGRNGPIPVDLDSLNDALSGDLPR